MLIFQLTNYIQLGLCFLVSTSNYASHMEWTGSISAICHISVRNGGKGEFYHLFNLYMDDLFK